MSAVVTQAELDMLLQRNPALKVRGAMCDVRVGQDGQAGTPILLAQTGNPPLTILPKDRDWGGSGRTINQPKAGIPNKTETRAGTLVEGFRQVGEAERGKWKEEKREGQRKSVIVRYQFERVNLRLAERTYYKPDWDIWFDCGVLGFVEVKGPHVWDGAREKVKIAAEMYPLNPFWIWQWKGGVWTFTAMPGYQGPKLIVPWEQPIE